MEHFIGIDVSLEQSSLCVVDASESMNYGTVGSEISNSKSQIWTKFDHATAIAASLSYMAIQQQDSVGLAVFDNQLKKYLKPSNSPAQWKTNFLSSPKIGLKPSSAT